MEQLLFAQDLTHKHFVCDASVARIPIHPVGLRSDPALLSVLFFCLLSYYNYLSVLITEVIININLPKGQNTSRDYI